MTALATPMNIKNRMRRYRFPRLRALQLTQARSSITRDFGTLDSLVRCHNAPVIRRYLVQSILGLGPKQSSMFLRNSGLTYDMAIIDRHVRDYMKVVQVGLGLPQTMQSLPIYEQHELSFRTHARQAGFEVGVFDWAVWIVMRAAKALEAR